MIMIDRGRINADGEDPDPQRVELSDTFLETP